MVMMLWTLGLLAAMQGAATPIVSVARGDMSAIDEPRQVVARTIAEWDALWKAHGSSQPLPTIDMTRQMVVAVFLGTRSTAGYAAEVLQVREDGGALVVEWRERRPPAGAITAQVLTAPYHIVTVPRREGQVRFVETSRR